MSLYRQYRPLDFSTLMGQDHVSEVLKGALTKDRVSHAYLFTGPRGTGKTSTARILSRAINCLKRTDAGPCNDCEICEAALNESLTDLVEIDAASHGLVDDARALVEQAKFMPVQAQRKIYIIDEVHMLSKSAFNALLKIIEEPPEHVHFILATTEAHKVLDTIKSRCQRFDFHLADDELIIQQLRKVSDAEDTPYEEEALALLARHARGSFRDALSLLEQVIGSGHISVSDVREVLGLSESAAVEQFVQYLCEADQEKALLVIQQIHDQGLDLYQFCHAVLTQLRQFVLQEQSSVPRARVLEWVDLFFHALDQLRNPVIPELPLELAVLKALQAPASQPQPENSKPQTSDTKESEPPTVAKKPAKTKTEAKVDKKKESVAEKPPVPTGTFDQERFITSIKQASLRSLVKYSQLSYENDELKITAKSGFELEKMQEDSNRNYLLDVLQEVMGKNVPIAFAVGEVASVEAPQADGLSSDDLKAVF